MAGENCANFLQWLEKTVHLYVHNAAKAIWHSFSQSLGSQYKESHSLIPAHMQITASTMDRSILHDLQRMLSGFWGREKNFSFCQCKQLARPCFGFLQIKRRIRQDSAPKTYLNWLWEVRIYMPVALADKEYNLFPLTRDNLPSLHRSPLGCKIRLPTDQGSFQSWGQPIVPCCRGSGNIF